MMILLMCTTSFALCFQPVSVILDSALVPFISLFIDIEHALCSLATFFFSFFPLQLKLVVEWELRDDNTKDLFCIKFPVELV